MTHIKVWLQLQTANHMTTIMQADKISNCTRFKVTTATKPFEHKTEYTFVSDVWKAYPFPPQKQTF